MNRNTEVVAESDEHPITDIEYRCDHGLLACRKCYTLPPGVNRFYPAGSLRQRMRELGRWALVVPNRADRRRRG